MPIPKISIIIPVFNAEKWLDNCIKSVVNQTIKSIEIILVDDGSTDKSGEICERWANHDARVKVFHQNNHGVSSARNLGLSYCTSKYISFIDSDDWVASDYIESLLSTATPNADMITSGLFWCLDENSIKRDELPSQTFNLNVEKDYLAIFNQDLITSPVGKLYSKEMIMAHNIKFDTSLSLGEDRDFNVQFLRYAKTVITTNYIGYYYRHYVPNSLTTKKQNKSFSVDYQYWKSVKRNFEERRYSTTTTCEFLAYRLYNIINDSISENIFNSKHDLRRRLDGIKKNFSLIDDNDFSYLKKRSKALATRNNAILVNCIINKHALLCLVFYSLSSLLKKWRIL